MQYLLGYDIGSSSIKASLLAIDTGRCVAAATSPNATELAINVPRPGWAEQDPARWWQEVVNATRQLRAAYPFDPAQLAGIGITYQMHGLVLLDRAGQVLRPAIIWCDSRAVNIGNQAFAELGEEFCLSNFLNSPGNFTASKLKWVRENEPAIYAQIHKIQLPGDYLAYRLTGELQTTVSGLSEGVFWNFKKQAIAQELLDYYGISADLLPAVVDTFAVQGRLTADAAQALGLAAGTPLSYRAGDQPNNAFSLNVLHAGEVAATAGTSGVIYGINETATADARSRVNSFVHVNSTREQPKNGVLMCLNGTGILNSWLRRMLGEGSYEQLNALAAEAPVGAAGLRFLPFGNGAERILENRPAARRPARPAIQRTRPGPPQPRRAGGHRIRPQLRPRHYARRRRAGPNRARRPRQYVLEPRISRGVRELRPPHARTLRHRRGPGRGARRGHRRGRVRRLRGGVPGTPAHPGGGAYPPLAGAVPGSVCRLADVAAVETASIISLPPLHSPAHG